MDERQKFLAQVAKEREERMRQNAISDVVEKIQSVARGRLSRKRFIQRFEKDFDEKFGLIYVEGKSSAALNSDFLKLGVLLLKLENRLEFVVRLGELCRKIAQSMFSNDKNATFAALFLDSGSNEKALSFMKSLFIKIPQILSTIDLDKVTLHKATTAIVSFLVLLTSPNLWSLSKTDQKILSTMTEVCRKYSACLLEPQQFSNLSSFLNICLKRTKPSQHADFVNNIVTVIYRVIKNSEFNEDEKITGLLAKNIYSCPGLMLLMNNTKILINSDEKKQVHQIEKNNDLINRLMKRLTVKDQPDYSTHLGPVSLTAVVCQLYQNSILTFQKLHDDIILGLSHNSILKQLWNFICNNSPKGPTHYLLSLFSADPSGSLPHFAPFSLFAHIAYTQISSLDESEMYEEGIPFSIRQLCDIAQFTNTFCFKAIWDNIIDFKQEKAEIIFLSLHKLCMLLHNRDARRSFVNDKDFWLANVSKYSGIITEFEKRTPRGQILMSKMPHLVPLKERMMLFRRLCAFDELATVDPDLYKNLTYIRKYKDSSDVADLELTFSVDEEFLGDIHTVDLPGGGRYTKVTNENKMKYVHQMAIYRVLTRTKMQTEAFVTGFRAIVNPDWLTLFSTFELQSLISGTRNDIDVADLKKNVQYYGGFHSNHRVIKWLWEIIENDFDAEERGLFLKFVTSCSRAPLLGFSYLEPPFSIRCIEVSDDQDQGDTLGSVVRGFLAIKKNKSTVRLPTSSTCFNLLKLPNYSKKSLLLEKLRYAIRAQAGFELS
ncbi:hypothetical protein FO519_003920 [Halicephalobus sp. NKZ332]|nr:hypothetical protein FO519_003920 [Halicephalobus sp. NKZ332]